MRVTKHGHACIEVDTGAGRLVVDPGMFTEPFDLAGVDAILVTHQHVDHLDQDRLRAALAADPALVVWTNPAVAALMADLGDRVRAVGHGDTFTAAGVEVEVHGELHAVIHPDIPRIANIGFRIGGSVIHPGDALTLPDDRLDALLLPVYAPWSRVQEVIDYARAVARHAHDRDAQRGPVRRGAPRARRAARTRRSGHRDDVRAPAGRRAPRRLNRLTLDHLSHYCRGSQPTRESSCAVRSPRGPAARAADSPPASGSRRSRSSRRPWWPRRRAPHSPASGAATITLKVMSQNIFYGGDDLDPCTGDVLPGRGRLPREPAAASST